MALDFDALKKKLDQKNRENSNLSFWRPENGRNEIRILPSAAGDNEFFQEGGVRWNIGPDKKRVTVPVSKDEPCPIREFVEKLKDSSDTDDKALAKRMRYSTRHYFNVIDCSLTEKDENYGKVLVYEAPTTVFSEVLSLILDPDYHDLLDPEKGYNLVVERSGKGLDTEYRVRTRKDPSPIPFKDWESQLNDLKILTTPKSYEDRLAILSGQSTSDSSSENNSDEVASSIQDALTQNKQQQASTQTTQEPPQQSEPVKEEPKVEEKQTPPETQQSAPAGDGPSGDDIRNQIDALINKNK